MAPGGKTTPLEIIAPTEKKKQKNQLVPYCVYPMLLDNILQRKLSSQAYLSGLAKERCIHVPS